MAPSQKPHDDENGWKEQWRRKSHIECELASSEGRKSDGSVTAKVACGPVDVKHRKNSRDDAHVNQHGAE